MVGVMIQDIDFCVQKFREVHQFQWCERAAIIVLTFFFIYINVHVLNVIELS